MGNNVANYGSDIVTDLLEMLGIEYVAFAPGATFRGLHDSIVNHSSRIRLVECTHEEVSVAIAHGYAKATGKVMAVAVHDVVGIQHASMAIYNAWCDRVPVVVLGGSGPADAALRRPWIDWIHTANPQASQVREYTKWDDQPGSIAAMPESLIRAYNVAITPPQGPVYVCLDTELQELELCDEMSFAEPGNYGVVRSIAADNCDVAQVADLLITADFPAIAAASIDRSREAAEDLAWIADRVGVAVVEPIRNYGRPALCMPTNHPMNVSGGWRNLPPADALVLVEVSEPASAGVPVSDGAKIIQVGTSVLAPSGWSADLQRLYRSDLSLVASPAAFLASLRQEISKRVGHGASLGSDRKLSIANHTSEVRAEWKNTAYSTPLGNDTAITQAYLAAMVWEAVQGLDPVLANGTLSDWALRTWNLAAPSSYLGSSGGAGLGYGLGASIGAALAHWRSERLVVDLQSDGDLMMTPGALWTAAHESVPLLIVVDNNRAYQNSVDHASTMASTRGRSVAQVGIGTTICNPFIDYAALANSMGLLGMGPVTDRPSLLPILEQASRTAYEQREPVLVEVVTAQTSQLSGRNRKNTDAAVRRGVR